MSRSLAVRPECIKKVKLAFKHSGIPRQQDLAEELVLSLNTVNSFLNGKGINRLSFIEICERLSLDWRDIADLGDSSSEISVTVKVASEVEIACVSDGVTPHQPPQESASEKRVVGIETIRTVPLWIGRDELLQELKERLLAPATTLKVLALVGQGGIGKTSLAAKLLEAVGTNLTAATLAADSPYNAVLCFKAEDGSSFDEVAGLLLKVLQMEASKSVKEAGEKINLILTGLRKQRTILLLDNLESILHPASHNRAGRAVTPEWGKLLNAFAYGNHCSQVILTSREIPADLADLRYPDSEPDGDLVAIVTVAGVAVAAAMEILRRKLKDSEADLRWIAERVGGHLFLLNQLGSLGKDKPGYLRKHPELVTRKAEPMLREQLARQSEAARDLLVRMCVLRVGIDIRGLTFLRLYTDDWEADNRLMMAAASQKTIEFTEQEVNETQEIINKLADGCLVESRYDSENCDLFYDLHQVVKEFVFVNFEERPQLFRRVDDFYRSGKSSENIQFSQLSLWGDALLFASYTGNGNETQNLVWNIVKYGVRFGDKNFEQMMLHQLENAGSEERAYFFRQIGRIHRDIGNWDIAKEYFQDALSIERKQKNQSGIANSLSCLGDIESNRGNWDEAERLYQQSLVVRTELGDRAGMAATWGVLGDIERMRGNFDAAEQLKRQSFQLRQELGDREGMAMSLCAWGEIKHARGDLNDAENLYKQSLEIRQELGDLAGIAIVMGCLGKNKVSQGEIDTAEELLTVALETMQALNMAPEIAEAKYNLARLERQRGNTQQAQQHYETAHQIFQQLGAAKDLEKIESEWAMADEVKED